MEAGQCSYPRAYKPPPKNIRRPNKPTPAPPPKRCWYYIEMQYKTPKGLRWKKLKTKMVLSDKIVARIAVAPLEDTLQALPLPLVSVLDYFKLIKMPLPEDENGRR